MNKETIISSENQKDVALVLDSIKYLEERMGELAIIDELVKKTNLGNDELMVILNKLQDRGEIEIPKKGFVRLSKAEKSQCIGCEKQIGSDEIYISSKGPYCGRCSMVLINKLSKIKQEELDDKMERAYRMRKRKNSKKVPSVAESVRQEQFEDKVEEELKERK